MSSSLEQTFKYWFDLLGDDLPEPATEYRFDSRRRWRFDCAWPDVRVYVELDGGTFTNGRHTRGAGFAADCEKINAATLKGWRGLRYTSDMLNNDPESVIGQVRALLEAE
jgi:very-short-patch-repair endonuclease